MERTFWSDERLDNAFLELRGEIRDLRTEMRDEFRGVRGELAQIKLFMLAGLVAILAAFIGLGG
jgi:hypothetical protein